MSAGLFPHAVLLFFRENFTMLAYLRVLLYSKPKSILCVELMACRVYFNVHMSVVLFAGAAIVPSALVHLLLSSKHSFKLLHY